MFEEKEFGRGFRLKEKGFPLVSLQKGQLLIFLKERWKTKIFIEREALMSSIFLGLMKLKFYPPSVRK